MNDKPHDLAMIELYRKDPEFARQVINSILDDQNGDQGELTVILRQVAGAIDLSPMNAPSARA